jgi:hypothetical protein
MPRPAAEDFGFAPVGDLFERVAVDEILEILLGRPVAEDQE